MPNTPALLGAGATGLQAANAHVNAHGRAMAEQLLAAAGSIAWIADETQMDAVTRSGSSPAYDVPAGRGDDLAAGEAEGLPCDAASALALRDGARRGAHVGSNPARRRTNRANA